VCEYSHIVGVLQHGRGNNPKLLEYSHSVEVLPQCGEHFGGGGGGGSSGGGSGSGCHILRTGMVISMLRCRLQIRPQNSDFKAHLS
jgi:hypothetical protein